MNTFFLRFFVFFFYFGENLWVFFVFLLLFFSGDFLISTREFLTWNFSLKNSSFRPQIPPEPRDLKIFLHFLVDDLHIFMWMEFFWVAVSAFAPISSSRGGVQNEPSKKRHTRKHAKKKLKEIQISTEGTRCMSKPSGAPLGFPFFAKEGLANFSRPQVVPWNQREDNEKIDIESMRWGLLSELQKIRVSCWEGWRLNVLPSIFRVSRTGFGSALLWVRTVGGRGCLHYWRAFRGNWRRVGSISENSSCRCAPQPPARGASSSSCLRIMLEKKVCFWPQKRTGHKTSQKGRLWVRNPPRM